MFEQDFLKFIRLKKSGLEILKIFFKVNEKATTFLPIFHFGLIIYWFTVIFAFKREYVFNTRYETCRSSSASFQSL